MVTDVQRSVVVILPIGVPLNHPVGLLGSEFGSMVHRAAHEAETGACVGIPAELATMCNATELTNSSRGVWTPHIVWRTQCGYNRQNLWRNGSADSLIP